MEVFGSAILTRQRSYEAVESVIPEEHRKLISHIRKTTERAKKAKAKARAGEDEEVRDALRVFVAEFVLVDAACSLIPFLLKCCSGCRWQRRRR